MRNVLIFLMFTAMFGLGAGIFLAVSDRFPKRELALTWERITTGKSTVPEKPAEPALPEEEPSFDQVVRARAAQAREVERREQEVRNLIQLAEARQAELDAKQKAIAKQRQELEQGYQDKQEEVVRQGRQNLFEKIEAMAPKLAKEFLLDQAGANEEMALELIKKLDPVQASKIFREFKQPDEIERLNRMLEKIGEGEPEKSVLPRPEVEAPAGAR